MSVFLLALVGTVALVLCVLSLATLHIIPSEVQPLSDPVSLYGTTRYSILYRVQVVGAGLCALCLLLALTRQSAALPIVGLVTLGCYGLSRIAIAGFMMDRPGGKRTRSGLIHGILAIITFTAIAIAVGNLTSELVAMTPWNRLDLLLQLAEYVTIISAIVFIFVSVLPSLHRFIGVVERGIYVGALCWLGLVVVPLLL